MGGRVFERVEKQKGVREGRGERAGVGVGVGGGVVPGHRAYETRRHGSDLANKMYPALKGVLGRVHL